MINKTIKIPPQNIELEQSILSSCILSPDDLEFAVEFLKSQDFYKTSHRYIFEAITELNNRGKLIDLITLLERLRENGRIEDIGGSVYLAGLLDDAPITSNIEQYCEILKNLAVKRRVCVDSLEIHKLCFDDTVGSVEVLDKAQQMVSVNENDILNQEPVRAGDLLPDLMDRYMRVNRSANGITGLETKFTRLDKMTGGLQNTDLLVLAARPGIGKTAFALDLARSFTEDLSPVLFVSLEMPNDQITTRMVSKISGVDQRKFRVGGILPKEWEKISVAMDRVNMMPFFIDSPKDSDFDVIKRKIRRAKRSLGLKIVMIDYLQLMVKRGDFNRRKDLEVGAMTRELKLLAKELNIPILLLSQLNRNVEGRNDKRPVLSDLRESGAVEQDADIVMFLYRDEVYNSDPNNENKGIGELDVQKHRNGPTGMVKLQWDDKTATFRNFYYGIGSQ